MPDFQLMESFGPEKKPSGWLGKFLRFSIIIFVIALALYLSVRYIYIGVLDRQSADLENKIKGLEKEIPTQDREGVVAFYSQLVNLQTLLGKHLYPSQIFERLELTTHPQVSFTNFNYDFNENRLQIDGYSQNLQAIAQQLLAFQRTSDFEGVTLSNIRQSADKTNFSMEIFFKSSLVLKNFQ
jgi:Tfp pilus assembly protein PilN